MRLPNPWLLLAVLAALGAVYGLGRGHGAKAAMQDVQAATQRKNVELFNLAEKTSRIAAELNRERAARAALQEDFEDAAIEAMGADRCAVDADSVQRIRALWDARP
ncbi:hypothetical protein [Falsihalocynthiibacter arcticus]|uniref:Uncharacterized protein n=1 Tax=Falsihalocynthiibacter arcticus TaxID=1579316 RepID=A0A126V1Z0_9RHOB|nr:hypothetical protein [Falsihalocynthiibacter arcticus]AML52341.1 hypothetical protein RC74_14610 [Falsihalocynthiibacter arcticus]